MNLYFPICFLKHTPLKAVACGFIAVCTLIFYNVVNAQQEKNPLEPDVLGMVYLLNSESKSLVPLEKQTVKIKSRGIVTSTGYLEAKGAKSPVRLKADQPLEFVVSLASGVDPNKFQLYPLTLRKKNREAILGKASVKGEEIGATAIPITVKKYGEAYKFTVSQKLAPGECGLTTIKFESIFSDDAKEVFCFGIDATGENQEQKKP